MTRGGKRVGAGRPKNSGKYNEKTCPIRVPVSLVDKIYSYVEKKGYALPFYESKVSAGFPSPADDFQENRLDLNEHLIQHPASTFFVRATGMSMIKAGIYPNDILVVDRSLSPRHGKVVIAVVDNDLTVKRLYQKNGVTKLLPENDDFDPIEIQEDTDLRIWGIVTNVIHAV